LASGNNKCRLALEDGHVFIGQSIGAKGVAGGEVVFLTAMTGYQEALTDPSYTGQILTMTYPLIGNYGINAEDVESRSTQAQVAGFVIKELSPIVSNLRASMGLHEYLELAGVVGLSGIDTRALTRRLRIGGACNGVISTEDCSDKQLVERAAALPSMSGTNLVCRVAPREGYVWSDGFASPFAQVRRKCEGKTLNVVAIDCGMKVNILRNLVESGCNVRVVGSGAAAEEILASRPDGVFVSNGPGDPSAVTDTIECLKKLSGKVPIFGICLGHQLLTLALGGRTYKLKFGHRGVNQPVRNEATGKVEITSQNHGFAADEGSLTAVGAKITHISLNDMTVEGFSHPDKAIFSVQYHPEASAGPHDASYLFDCFRSMMETGCAPSAQDMHEAQLRLAGVHEQ
jgi:carbamoyl-phosphate synthase small subunit